MIYLLDTCVVSDFFKKDSSVISHFEKCSPNQLHISSITVMEIEYGLNLHKERERKIRPLWESLKEQIQILSFSEPCAVAAASFRAQLKSKGSPIGPFDLLIAATALSHEAILVTSNMSEFARMPELKIEDWRVK